MPNTTIANIAQYILKYILRYTVYLATALPKKKAIFNKNAILYLLSPSSVDKAVIFIKPPSLLLIMLYKTKPII